MTTGPFWREDNALDEALAALAPPSAPRTSAADILALGAVTPAAPLPPVKPSVTSTAGSVQGIAAWKVAAVAMVGATLGLAALQALDHGPTPSTIHEAPALGMAAAQTAAGPPEQLAAPLATTVVHDTAGQSFLLASTAEQITTVPVDTPAPPRVVASVVDTGLTPAPYRAQAPPAPAPDPREEMLTVRVAAPKFDGQTRLRLAGGLLAAPRTSRAAVSSMGPELQLSVARLGPSDTAARPMLVAELDLGTQIPEGLRTARFCGGALVGAGFAIDGSRIRLELAWTGGARVAPDASYAVADQERPRPTLRPTMGPQLGVAIHPDQGPDIHFGATLQGTLQQDDAMASPRVQPWLGISAGIDLPVPRSAG